MESEIRYFIKLTIIMKKIGAIAVAGLLFISSTQAQEVGDVVNDPNTFLKMLSTVKD